MITFEIACKHTNDVREKMCPTFSYTTVFEMQDRWAFILSPVPRNSEDGVVAPPSFYIYKEDGRFEWFSIPPLENLDILETGKEIDFLSDL